jgi:molybdate transport system regulatory protein
MMALRVRSKVWLEHGDRFVVGDGGLQLLHAIDRHGSLTAAARAVGWSYRHAWAYLRRAQDVLGVPLARARPGKGARRGTALTEAGHAVLGELMEARRAVDAAVGAGGPTRQEVAARGRSGRRAGRRDRGAAVQPER